MTSKANQDWMRMKGYDKYWVLPQYDLNNHFPYYRNPSPTGNHAESMPWDSTCNKDHDDIVCVTLRQHMGSTSTILASSSSAPRKTFLSRTAGFTITRSSSAMASLSSLSVREVLQHIDWGMIA